MLLHIRTWYLFLPKFHNINQHLEKDKHTQRVQTPDKIFFSVWPGVKGNNPPMVKLSWRPTNLCCLAIFSHDKTMFKCIANIVCESPFACSSSTHGRWQAWGQREKNCITQEDKGRKVPYHRNSDSVLCFHFDWELIERSTWKSPSKSFYVCFLQN